jgi:hypothetical protein
MQLSVIGYQSDGVRERVDGQRAVWVKRWPAAERRASGADAHWVATDARQRSGRSTQCGGAERVVGVKRWPLPALGIPPVKNLIG